MLLQSELDDSYAQLDKAQMNLAAAITRCADLKGELSKVKLCLDCNHANEKAELPTPSPSPPPSPSPSLSPSVKASSRGNEQADTPQTAITAPQDVLSSSSAPVCSEPASSASMSSSSEASSTASSPASSKDNEQVDTPQTVITAPQDVFPSSPTPLCVESASSAPSSPSSNTSSSAPSTASSEDNEQAGTSHTTLPAPQDILPSSAAPVCSRSASSAPSSPSSDTSSSALSTASSGDTSSNAANVES